jgi:signal peptide peptidase SppA
MPWRKAHPLVAVLRLSGVIASGGRLGTGLSLATHASAIERAFKIEPAAVALLINSPGGSAAQSHLLFQRIRALAEEKQKPVFAFVEDVAASGGYMLACAADEIFADESSILGSIGVISAGFGFADLIARLGVERRLHTSGERKSALDAFKPESPEDVARLQAIQREVHQSFIDLVKARRGPRLKAGDELFTGEFWAGKQSVALGLADGIGDAKMILEARFGKKVRLISVAPERRLLRRLGLGAGAASPHRLLPSLAEDGLAQIEARSLWSRFGL